jgi:D-alanine--poly(phosphoribitol) ligase subunit 2
MSSPPEVNERVRRIFVDALKIEVPSEDTDLIEAGYIDSLALVELLFALEREFSVSVPLDELDIDNFRTVNRIGELVVTVNGSRPAT